MLKPSREFFFQNLLWKSYYINDNRNLLRECAEKALNTHCVIASCTTSRMKETETKRQLRSTHTWTVSGLARENGRDLIQAYRTINDTERIGSDYFVLFASRAQ